MPPRRATLARWGEEILVTITATTTTTATTSVSSGSGAGFQEKGGG